MTKLKVQNLEGKEVEELDVEDSVFNVPANDDLIHQVAVTISANRRQVLAHTKTRGERAGSGKKPWKQKGTGRARVGSVRTPLWKKGGVVFGPRADRNYKKSINRKMNAKAIAMVLSGKIKDGEMIIVDKFEFKEKKTRLMAEALKNLKVAGRALIAFAPDEKDMRTVSRNIAKVENILSSQLNVLDMLNNKYLIMSKDSVKMLEDKYKQAK